MYAQTRQKDLLDLTIRYDARDDDIEARLRSGGSSGAILEEILFQAEVRYWQFTPTHGASPWFVERLWRWLDNEGTSEDDKIILLRTVPLLQFVDRDDMIALYRAAFLGPISRWLMDQAQLDFTLPDNELKRGLDLCSSETWYCPITDSMDIAQFHHANGIAGKDQRPDWRTLNKFGDIQKIKDYMTKNGLKRLVLLEDFVGSGRQTRGPVNWAAAQLAPSIPVLFVPLIISAFGLDNLRTSLDASVRLEPLFVVPKHVHIRAEPEAGELPLFSALRKVVTSTFSRVNLPKPEDPFGFSKIGALVVLHTNCPNNTLPIVWYQSPEWSALFPRVSRA